MQTINNIMKTINNIMKTINDIKSLIINLFRSIPFKFRIHIPFLISISIIVFAFFVPSLKFWRGTVGYNLLGMTYFVSIFSIINIMELKNLDLVSKNAVIMAIKKQNLPSKICVICGRPFSWRKKWERDWENVIYCSKRCQSSKKNMT